MMMSLFDTGVIPAINQHLLDEAAKVRDYGEYWSASSAGYCMRKNMFERLKVPYVKEDARKQRVFSSGHIFHQWIQAITKTTGLSIAQEIELQDEELMIRGHIDDLVLVRDTQPMGYIGAMVDGKEVDYPQHLILYDYKTAHSRWFEYAKDRPMSHYHKMQLGTYMYMLRNAQLPVGRSRVLVEVIKGRVEPDKFGGLKEARILKISKDDLRLFEQQLLWTPELEKEVYSYWSTLNGYWKEKKFPKCTCADYENGFMAKEKWNPYYFEGEPCSIKWYTMFKEKDKNDDNP